MGDDPEVIEGLRQKWLLKPSTQEYNLENGNNNDDIDYNPSFGQTQVILDILKEKVPICYQIWIKSISLVDQKYLAGYRTLNITVLDEKF